MSHDPQVTISGNVGKDAPRDVVFENGDRLAEFSLGYTPQKRTEKGWEDMPTVWMRVVAKKSLAARVIEHVTPGTLLVVTGTLRSEPWVTKDGEPRSTLKLHASDIGLHLHGKKFASPAYQDTQQSQQGGYGQRYAGDHPGGGYQQGQQDDGQQWGQSQQWGQNPGGWGQ